jgi:hypothetical protein
MDYKLVAHYRMRWHQETQKGEILLMFEDESKHHFTNLTAEELTAMSQILQQAPVALYKNGVLSTMWEPVVDNDNP